MNTTNNAARKQSPRRFRSAARVRAEIRDAQVALRTIAAQRDEIRNAPIPTTVLGWVEGMEREKEIGARWVEAAVYVRALRYRLVSILRNGGVK